MVNADENKPAPEDFYLGKRVLDLNIYEQRYRKLMQLIRLDKMLKSAEVTHKKLP